MDKFVTITPCEKTSSNSKVVMLGKTIRVKKLPSSVFVQQPPKTAITQRVEPKVEPKNLFTNMIADMQGGVSNIINVFTDGSCIQNAKNKKNRPAGYACVFPEHPQYNYGAKLEGPVKTNNRAEYMACIKAFEIANTIDPTKTKVLCVYTDSELMINSLTKWLTGWKAKGWKKSDGSPVLNVDLLKIMDIEKQKRVTIFKHVKAHTGKTDWQSVHNDMADKLAKSAALK